MTMIHFQWHLVLGTSINHCNMLTLIIIKKKNKIRQSRLHIPIVILIKLFKLGTSDAKKHRSAPQSKTVMYLVIELCIFATFLKLSTVNLFSAVC